jgi:hypothetical protein
MLPLPPIKKHTVNRYCQFLIGSMNIKTPQPLDNQQKKKLFLGFSQKGKFGLIISVFTPCPEQREIRNWR